MPGSLKVVGTGFAFPAQATLEAIDAMRNADIVFYNVGPEGLVSQWIKENCRAGHDLYTCYEEGGERLAAYERMVDAIVASVEAGNNVVAAFYGHPGVFVNPGGIAVRRCREKGYEALMQPGIAAVDCLYADLLCDPSVSGMSMVEATQYIATYRHYSTGIPLIVWQAGVSGDTTFNTSGTPRNADLLPRVLSRRYPPDHTVIVYLASTVAGFPPRVDLTTVGGLGAFPLHAAHTLLVPPSEPLSYDAEMEALLKDRMTAPTPNDAPAITRPRRGRRGASSASATPSSSAASACPKVGPSASPAPTPPAP